MRISDWSSDVCSSDLFPDIAEIGQQQRMIRPLTIGADEIALGIIGMARGDNAAHHEADHLAAEWRGLHVAILARGHPHARAGRSEERRVGQELVSTFNSRWSPEH